MLSVSEVLMSNHDMTSFGQLVEYVRRCARQGEIFFEMDLRPPFEDTPDDWAERLEAAFSSADNIP
ncbi:MAG: sulfur relay protein DsrC [Gammaproteobacteria bacterium]|nr:sulfur relay protein DsrC [Gammaproteobacteria bacterium]MDD9806709.1 sulfur relay protein DsrC [Gammaproteobacteria bacterium]MDD9868809.1 sulfur relay protein DsrC [Gammaproteobacteria bacterium]MDD9886931.1 sulfur relay protein DsrC [Gammaproteobacteria bacterium]